jgi:hypothetical protein
MSHIEVTKELEFTEEIISISGWNDLMCVGFIDSFKVYSLNQLTDTYDLVDTYTAIANHSKVSFNDRGIAYYLPASGELAYITMSLDTTIKKIINVHQFELYNYMGTGRSMTNERRILVTKILNS